MLHPAPRRAPLGWWALLQGQQQLRVRAQVPSVLQQCLPRHRHQPCPSSSQPLAQQHSLFGSKTRGRRANVKRQQQRRQAEAGLQQASRQQSQRGRHTTDDHGEQRTVLIGML